MQEVPWLRPSVSPVRSERRFSVSMVCRKKVTFDAHEGNLKLPPGLEDLDKSEPMCSTNLSKEPRITKPHAEKTSKQNPEKGFLGKRRREHEKSVKAT